MHVARSEIMRKVDEDDIRYNQKYIEKQVSSLADGARGMHLGINNMTGKVLEFLVVDPRVEEVRTWEAWVTSMQYHCAFYQVSMAEPYSRVECSVGGRLWDLGSLKPNWAINASSWIGVMRKALTCRSADRSRFLAHVPVEVLRSAGESEGSRFMAGVYAEVEAWQAFVLGSPDAAGLVERARVLSDPKRASFAADHAEMVTLPELDVLGRLVAGDGPGFNEALVRALESYREYSAEEFASGGFEGIVPLGLLALACLAHDGAVEGVSLEVESDYLPAGIVNGSWLDAFPV
ncbi:immunity 49 family protein [Nocardiopsis listeri]|uniref:immunity 49 family protein n=1 Tax=Nocardiopsis listeri TaxID=53440 RepID=UPI000A070232|nr:immunity 49 family protein [Nocardiopsis listeri]